MTFYPQPDYGSNADRADKDAHKYNRSDSRISYDKRR